MSCRVRCRFARVHFTPVCLSCIIIIALIKFEYVCLGLNGWGSYLNLSMQHLQPCPQFTNYPFPYLSCFAPSSPSPHVWRSDFTMTCMSPDFLHSKCISHLAVLLNSAVSRTNGELAPPGVHNSGLLLNDKTLTHGHDGQSIHVLQAYSIHVCEKVMIFI